MCHLCLWSDRAHNPGWAISTTTYVVFPTPCVSGTLPSRRLITSKRWRIDFLIQHIIYAHPISMATGHYLLSAIWHLHSTHVRFFWMLGRQYHQDTSQTYAQFCVNWPRNKKSCSNYKISWHIPCLEHFAGLPACEFQGYGRGDRGMQVAYRLGGGPCPGQAACSTRDTFDWTLTLGAC